MFVVMSGKDKIIVIIWYNKIFVPAIYHGQVLLNS